MGSADTITTAAALTGATTAVLTALNAKRLPRQLKVRLFRELVSPILAAITRDAVDPDFGPEWSSNWEHLADEACLKATVTRACRPGLVTWVDLKNQPIRRSRFKFAYQDLADPRLRILRDVLRLDSVVSGSSGDLDRFRRLTSFVRNIADHTDDLATSMSYGAPVDAFSILDGVSIGQTLQCNAYSLLLIQILGSLGYVARQCSCGYFEPREHVVVEVWSPEFAKWIILDPDYDLVYLRHGSPISAYEAQQIIGRLEAEFRDWAFDGVRAVSQESERRQALLRQFVVTRPSLLGSVTGVRGTVCSERIPRKLSTTPTGIGLEWFRSFAIALRNDHLSRKYVRGHPRRTAQVAMSSGAARWLEDFDGNLTDDVSDLYWSVNCVRLAFEPCVESNAVRVRLGTFTPCFDRFRLTVNGCTQESREPTVLWRFGTGLQSLSVVAVNAMGVAGAPSTVGVRIS